MNNFGSAIVDEVEKRAYTGKALIMTKYSTFNGWKCNKIEQVYEQLNENIELIDRYSKWDNAVGINEKAILVESNNLNGTLLKMPG